MKRRLFFWIAAGWELALMAAFAAPEPAPASSPNIVVILTDDQRHNTIHALGCEEVSTPNMDRLASVGTAFLNACIMGGTSGAVCVPSRAMLMTGRTLFRLDNKIGSATTFPQWFREHGYTTFMTGKWHNEQAACLRSFERASAVFFGGMGKTNQGFPGGEGVEITLQDFDGTKLSAPRPSEKDATELIADRAVGYIETLKDARPFLLYVAFTSPHDPRVAPERFRKLYEPAKLKLPPNFLPEHPFDNGDLKGRDEQLAKFPRTREEILRHLADYYASISWLDSQIGQILSALQRSGRLDQTIIAMAGDNGLALGQHGLMGKQSVYEHSVRVPLIIRAPGLAVNRRSEAYCYLLDLFPTLCELAQIPKPEGLEGISLAPILRGQEQRPGRNDLFFAFRDLQRAVKTPDWKLIEYSVPKQPSRTQLFDLKHDPWETTDLAQDPRQSNTVRQLRLRLAEWQKDLDDPLPKGDYSHPWMSRFQKATNKVDKPPK